MKSVNINVNYEDPAYKSPDDHEVKYQLYRPKETK